MDIAAIKPQEALVNINHPATQEPIGVTVSLMSINDERMKIIRRQIQDRRIKLEQKGKSFKAEEIEENGYELAFRAMTGWQWEGETTFNGKKPEFEKAAVVHVFKSLPWFHEQVMDAISDEKRFFAN
ncbi:hypothetical protein [Rhizobium phage RHph_X2_24]|nr:hypothetical protein [Rhizobium phage RHph_X2_24]